MAKIQKNTIFIFLCALLTVTFFTFSVNKNSFSIWPSDSSILIRTGLLVFIFFIYKKILASLTFTPNLFFILLTIIISAVFSVSSVMGKFYVIDTNLTALSPRTALLLFRLILLFIGGFCFFYIAIFAIGMIPEVVSAKSFPKLRRISYKLFDKHCFGKSLGILTLFWIPQIIIQYPSTMSIDAVSSLAQYYGMRDYTSQHPIIYTQLLGRFSDLGNALGNVGLGLFFLMLLQCVTLLLVLAYTINTMKKLGVPEWMLFITLIIFAVVPIFSGYATTLIIDTFYDAFLLLLMDELTWYLFRPRNYFGKWTHPVLTFVSVLGLFFRQNGSYVAAVIILFGACRGIYLIIHKKQVVRCVALFLAMLIIPLGIGKVNVSHLYQKYDAHMTSKRAMFAIPIQQIGRYMYSHSDDITPEELASIQKVLNYTPEQFAERYMPYQFDGLKTGFNNDASSEDIRIFLQTWIKLFFRHPATYIHATLNQNFALFSPLNYNYRYYTSTWRGLEKITSMDFSSIYEHDAAWADAKTSLRHYYEALSSFPFIGLMTNQGVMDLFLLAICLYALCEKNGRLLLLGLPLLLTLAVTFIGPALMGHPRYMYPVSYGMPLFFGMFLIRKNIYDKQLG